MGYSNYSKLDYVRTFSSFAEAARKWHETAPIRGRADKMTRPLGRRKDIDTLWIRADREDNPTKIELGLYRTPVLAWTPDDRITVCFGRWTSAYTARFIEEVMPGVRSVRNTRNRVVIDLHNKQKVVMNAEERVTFAYTAETNWAPLNAKKGKQWAINRAEAKRIDKMYKPFTDYVKLCMNLTKTDHPDRAYISRDMIDPYVTSPPSTLSRCYMKYATPNPQGRFMEYLRNWQAMATSGDVEKMQAAMGMFFAGAITSNWAYKVGDTTQPWTVAIRQKLGQLREIILRAHAEEVLELREVDEAKVPATTYDNWALGPAMEYE